MKKVLVVTEKPFAKVAVDGIKNIIEKAGYQFILLEKYTGQDAFIKAVADADAVIVRSDIADKQVIEAGRILRLS